MRRIGGFFGRSAFGPLSEQMMKVKETVEEVPRLINALFAGNQKEAADAAVTIDRLEGQTDDVKDEIRANLSHSLFSSVERNEVLTLVKLLDGIADNCQRLAKRITLRKTPFPDVLRRPVRSLVEQVVKCIHTLERAVVMMRDLEEQGLDRSAIGEVDEMLRSVAYVEYQADEAEHDALEALFSHEKELDPVSTIFLMELISALGSVADQAENSADGFRRLIGSR